MARTLAKLFDAVDALDTHLVEGRILDDLRDARKKIRDGLEAEGWTVSYQTGQLKGSNRCHVYIPGSSAGARIRKDRVT